MTFDAVSRMQQEVVFFKDRFMWRSHPNFDMIGIAFISSLWEDVPSHINAAYEDVEGGTILFFKGTQYWEVRGMTLQDNSPKNITELGLPRTLNTVDAAFHLRLERQTVFFTGRVCWRYDNERQRMMDGYPKLISQEWPGISGPIDGAVVSNGVLYFFSGTQMREYDLKLKRATNTLPANTWLRC
ncbi:stromelysin-1-like [Sardina pilchardus]|uniref:stromelysin-1-like n=1 Tax=Sardina pilchardus TaxID=27697 RepID=UPI002E147076